METLQESENFEIKCFCYSFLVMQEKVRKQLIILFLQIKKSLENQTWSEDSSVRISSMLYFVDIAIEASSSCFKPALS